VDQRICQIVVIFRENSVCKLQAKINYNIGSLLSTTMFSSLLDSDNAITSILGLSSTTPIEGHNF